MSENHLKNPLGDQSKLPRGEGGQDVEMSYGPGSPGHDLITYARRVMVDHGVQVKLGEVTLRFAVRGQEFSDGSDHELWFKAMESGLFMRAEGSRGSQQTIHWMHLGSSDDAHETLAPYVEHMTADEIHAAWVVIAADVALNIHRRAAVQRMRGRDVARGAVAPTDGACQGGAAADAEPMRNRGIASVYRGG